MWTVLCLEGCLGASLASARRWCVPLSAGVTTQGDIIKCLQGPEGKIAPSGNKINIRNAFDRLIFLLTF